MRAGQRLTGLPDGEVPQPIPTAAAELVPSAYESISFDSQQRLLAAEARSWINGSSYGHASYHN